MAKKQKEIFQQEEEEIVFPDADVIQGQQVITSRLYKLEVSDFMKNVAIDNEPPRYVETEHVHYFHSHDSSGRKLEHSCAVGGHFHVMKIVPNPKGAHLPPAVVCNSGPMRMVTRKDQYGRKTVVPAPASDVDSHRHETVYLSTSKGKTRTFNAEAAKAIASEQTKEVPPQGLEVR